MHLDTKGSDVLLLKLSSQVTLDESRLACASITNCEVLGSIAKADTARGGEQITQDS